MEKEAFYFPHFCNARHDRKIRRLRRELGVEGYGIYFMLLETLREQQDLMYPMDDLDLLSDEFGVSEAKIRTTICNYELFEVDQDQKFFSPKMLMYLEPYFRMKEQRKMAGKASAEKRISTTVQRPFNKGKESKVNEIKENENKVNEIVFSDLLSPHIQTLGTEFENFKSYWTEKNAKGKERWQSEKFFDISRRISTWMANKNKFNSNNNGNSNGEKLGTSAARNEALRNW
jgi:hypothetical protein